MSILQIHIIMLALAVVAGFLAVGSKTFQRANATGHKTGPSGQQRTLGFLAFVVVAASPLIRFWRTSLTDTVLLQQSLLVAAIGLLSLLLYALLQKPATKTEPQAIVANETDTSLAPIRIDADDEHGTSASADDHDSTITLDQDKNLQSRPVTVQTSLADFPSGVDVINEPMNLGQAANDHEKASSGANIDISNLAFVANLERVMEDNKTAELSLQAFSPAIKDGESLDLSDTGQLYAELRAQTDDVDLPDNEEWLTELDDSVDLDDSLVLADEHISTVAEHHPDTSIIDGELLQATSEKTDDVSLVFGDDLTGEYAHPDVVETTQQQGIEMDDTLSATLAETLAISKTQNATLIKQIDALNNKLVELQTLHQQLDDESHQNQLTSAEMIVNREKLLDQESGARRAAEAVITQQREILSRSQQQQTLIKQLLQEERTQFANMQEEVEKSKATARQAAALARKAAIAHQSIRGVARREQQARLRSQKSAKRAVDIARNAISALAAEERKNTFYKN